jgi:AraC-like DNA-binding protein|tara:strand:+ start:12064 stop:13149 length:1086 start_codon:yes stop_codon:yes gene_type:complete
MQQTPTFDTWTAGFLVAVAMGLFLGILLLSDKNRKVRPIAFFIFAFSFILLQYVLYWTGYQFVYPYFVFFPVVCYYLTGPLLYWYFLSLYRKTVSKTLLLHFLPALLCAIPYVATLLKNTIAPPITVPLAWLPQYYQFIIMHMLIYTCLLFRIVHTNKHLHTEYAQIRKKWAKFLVTLYALFVVAYISYYVLVNFPFFNNEWDYAISIVMSGSIYAIGYFIFKQPQIFDGEFYASFFLPATTSSLEIQLLDELYKKITDYMVQNKPYTNNELRLANLADQLGFSTHLLSKVINQKSGVNFNTFVNQYRLAEAEKLLQNEFDTPIKTVYYDVGFNSKAAFYHAFKKKHQCTPMQYKQRFQLS